MTTSGNQAEAAPRDDVATKDDLIHECETEMRKAAGLSPEITPESLIEHIKNATLSEAQLRDLKIQPQKKYLGPISAGTTGEIYGPRGIGKTQIRDVMSICVTRGLNMPPFQCQNAASVLIVDGEMSLPGLQDRQHLADGAGEPMRELGILPNELLFQNGCKAINLTDESWQAALLEYIEGSSWDVIFFDNLSSLTPGIKESDSEAWGPINQFFLKLRWMGKAVIFVHHAGKNGDQRGTSGREDSLDWVLKLTLPANYDPKDGCRLNATLTKSRSLTGAEAEPFEFKLIDTPTGGITWQTTAKSESNKALIINMLGEGFPQREIPGALGVDKGYVSRVKKAAMDAGLLHRDGGRFTTSGYELYGNINPASSALESP